MEISLTPIRNVLGHRLLNAWRIGYEFKDGVNTSVGPLELHFDNGKHLFLRGANDGEHLIVSESPWQNPFAEPLSPQNAAYIRQYGQPIRVDSSITDCPLPIGELFKRYCLLRNQFNTVAGAVLWFETSTVAFLVECDEDYVMCGNDERLAEWGFAVDGSTCERAD